MPINDLEKQVLRKTLKTRVIIGLLFLLPISIGLAFLAYSSIVEFTDGSYDAMMFITVLLILTTSFFIFKYALPFYVNSFRNTQEINKLYVATKILSIDVKHTSKGLRYFILTDYMKIDSWKVSIIKQSLKFSEMTVNMNIAIHCFENNKVDILDITKI